jgi:NAD(P)H-hydrate epimerase
VLAGILVAYLARAAAAGALRPAELARRAVYVHGLAGDLAAADLGAEGLIASDLIAYLPAAQRALRRA